MEKTLKTLPNGSFSQDNAILDEIIDLFNEKGLNDGTNDELIKKLAIIPFRYAKSVARICCAGYADSWEVFETGMNKQISSLGGEISETDASDWVDGYNQYRDTRK